MEGIKVVGEWYFYINNKLIKKEKNLLVQSGLNFLAALLVNEQSNDISIHLALGIGTTSPAAGDTILQSETLRKVISAKSRTANVARFRTFFLTSEAIGTFQEYGIFLASSDAKDSGILLNRIVVPISHASGQVLTIEVKINFVAG